MVVNGRSTAHSRKREHSVNTSLKHNQRGESNPEGAILTAILIIFIVIFGEPLAGMMTDDTKATHALTQLGFTDVQIISKDVWFVFPFKGCNKNDQALYTVSAKDATGQVRTVDVCAGIWNGGTIRG